MKAQLTKTNLESRTKVILSRHCDEKEFYALMDRARRRFGLCCWFDNPRGFFRPNFRDMAFRAGGYEYRLEQFAEFDFFDDVTFACHEE